PSINQGAHTVRPRIAHQEQAVPLAKPAIASTLAQRLLGSALAAIRDAFSAPEPDARPMHRLAMTRMTTLLAFLVLGAAFACMILGLVLTRQNDDVVEHERRIALRGAVENVRAITDVAKLDARYIRILEAATGLKDLRFETEPALDERE